MFAQPAALLLFVSEKLSDREPFEWFLEFAFVRRNHTDRKSTRLNSSHSQISYAVFCLKKKKNSNKDIVYCTLLYLQNHLFNAPLRITAATIPYYIHSLHLRPPLRLFASYLLP